MDDLNQNASIQYKRIRLSDIKLEDSFRTISDDPTMALSASKRGLEEALVVEGPDDEQKFTLVHGYIRYQALISAEELEATCMVQPCTDTTQRILKRLRKESHTHKRTGYELERMIHALLAAGLSEQEIAVKTDVRLATVRRYIKTKDIDNDLRSMAGKTGASREGLSKLWRSRHLIKSNTMENLLSRFVKKEGIKGSDVDSILKVAKVRQFDDLPESAQEQCVNHAVAETKFTSKKAKEIVYEQVIQKTYDHEAFTFLYDKVCERLAYVAEIKAGPFFYDNLTAKQRKHLNDLWRSSWIPVTPPLKWGDFPHDHPANEEEPDPPYN